MKTYKLMFALLKEHRLRFILGTFLLAITDPLSNIVAAWLFIDIFDGAVYDASLILPTVVKFFMLTGTLALITPLGKYLVEMAALHTTARLRETLLNKLI